MGSPISSTLAEIYLQYLKEIYVKHWLENREIILYKRYVDDILSIYDQIKTDETTIHNTINNIDKNLEFKITEENNTISYLDLSINRNSQPHRTGNLQKTHTWTSSYTALLTTLMRSSQHSNTSTEWSHCPSLNKRRSKNGKK